MKLLGPTLAFGFGERATCQCPRQNNHLRQKSLEIRTTAFIHPPHPVTGKPCPPPKRGWNAPLKALPGQRSFSSIAEDNRIVWGSDEKKIPQIKRFLHEAETNVGKSVIWIIPTAEKQTSAMFGRSGVFLAPKHSDFVARFIQHAGKADSTILDCFGGSGRYRTCRSSKLNRQDNGNRKFVLIEAANYFDDVLKPRVVKSALLRNGAMQNRWPLTRLITLLNTFDWSRMRIL